MCSGVNDNVARIIVRQMNVRGVAAERELQHAHAGKTKIITKLLDFWRDHAQVFCDDRQFSKLTAYRVEEFASRRVNPKSPLSSFVSAGNFPARDKPAKVI